MLFPPFKKGLEDGKTAMHEAGLQMSFSTDGSPLDSMMGALGRTVCSGLR